MRPIRSGWCETGFCSRCPELLQVANGRRREIHCDCSCHAGIEIERQGAAANPKAGKTSLTLGLI
jgi:hypothetical protein